MGINKKKKKNEICFSNSMAKHIMKFHPNFNTNNIFQQYFKIYGQIVTKFFYFVLCHVTLCHFDLFLLMYQSECDTLIDDG